MLETVVLIILAGAAFMGLRKGLIRQAASLAAVILGVTACRLFGRQAAEALAPMLPHSWGGEHAATILGCAALFIVAGLAVALAARFLSAITHALMLGLLDRAAGAVFTLAEAAIALSILLNLWLAVSGPETRARCSEGFVVPAVAALAPALMDAHAAPADSVAPAPGADALDDGDAGTGAPDIPTPAQMRSGARRQQRQN